MKYSLKKNMLYQYNNDIDWDSAVNFIFIEDSIFFIQRSDSMPSHAGQVAFVGGHKKKYESHPFETAMREFEEETGFNSKNLLNMNLLEPVSTVSRTLIFPVVSEFNISKKEFLKEIKSNGEWSSAYLVPSDYLFNIRHWSKGYSYGNDRIKPIYFCPIPVEKISQRGVSDSNKVILWGATARIIWNFFKKHIDDAKN